MYSPTHIQCPDGTTQGHLRKQLQMVTDAAEGLEDSSGLYIYLCLYVFMQGHGSYPGLGFDGDKEHTAAADPNDSKMVTWPAGWSLPSWLPMVGADKLEGVT